MKRIAILGSTGSIGKQALEVISHHPHEFAAEVLTARNNHELLIAQALKYRPSSVVIGDESKDAVVREALKGTGIEVHSGHACLGELAAGERVDMVLTAMVGFAGLMPTLCAIRGGKPIALANKETLVVAGDLVTRLAAENQVKLIPVDSEHSAIFQCLVGESIDEVEKILITASGGPFRTLTEEQLAKVTCKDALKHPTWNMGAKITIDSATLMNKGLEAIEARWLFGLTPEQIDVVVHPQSIVHSLVQFHDGSIKAQIGLPDMRLPIQYAFTWPRRLPVSFPRFRFEEFPVLSFEAPDHRRFPNLSIALEVMRKGGNLACVMNAANEIAVDAFLNEKISFSGITRVIEKTLEKATFVPEAGLIEYIESDHEARTLALSFV